MNKALADLIKISNSTGRDSTLVQGGGGNTSVKTADGKFMYIKASGTALKDMTPQKGWRRMKLEPVMAIIKDKSLARLGETKRETEVVNRLLSACDDDRTDGSRPSVEAHLHSLLDKCVIHLHPLVIGAYINARKGRSQIEKVFKSQKYPPLWVPYTDPGFLLARKMAQLIDGYIAEYGRKPSVMILEKHGLFVTAKTANSALAIVKKTIKLCRANLKERKAVKIKTVRPENIAAAKLAIRGAVLNASGAYTPVTYIETTKEIAAFMARRNAGKLLAAPALNPDELIYANGPAMWLQSADRKLITKKLTTIAAKGEKLPSAFLIKNLGLFIAADNKLAPTIAEIATGSFVVRSYAARFGGVLSLTKRQRDFIANWESEAFRKKLASAKAEGLLQNRIAFVTGSGSGLGRSIAIGLARAGASVAIADIDKKSAAQTAELIEKELPAAQTLVLKCDVTDKASVDAAFNAVVRRWGGLDISVNAAGIAPAGPLVELSVDKWRRTLEINLTGYFLCAQAAAKIMIAQNAGGSIVNLSSKSGLQASKDNTPYNATKAGEIHMARGWALELGQYGIRVNSVAPGNVFEGSKIWNSQYIKACARKYDLKPEEVIPYYINKTALKREIKGKDVADSVVFLCSDMARTITGQTIVTDAGQVMVR